MLENEEGHTRGGACLMISEKQDWAHEGFTLQVIGAPRSPCMFHGNTFLSCNLCRDRLDPLNLP